MPIKFLNVPGSTNLRSSRPTGYKFPTGLSTPSNTSVDYLVIAGGGAGGNGSSAGSYGAGGGGAGGYRTAVGTSGGSPGAAEPALSLSSLQTSGKSFSTIQSCKYLALM